MIDFEKWWTRAPTEEKLAFISFVEETQRVSIVEDALYKFKAKINPRMSFDDLLSMEMELGEKDHCQMEVTHHYCTICSLIIYRHDHLLHAFNHFMKARKKNDKNRRDHY